MFGQVPLFFYLLHIPLLEAAGALTAVESVTLGPTYVAVVAVLLVLYPACLHYRSYKRAHPCSEDSSRTGRPRPTRCAVYGCIRSGNVSASCRFSAKRRRL